jgi:hypothetical protein
MKKKPKTFGIMHTRTPVTPELLLSKEGRKLLRSPQTDTLLNRVERKARRVLRQNGLDENWLVHIQKAPDEFPDEQAFHAVNILAHLARVRFWIRERKTKPAILETILMMNAIADSMITVLEPDTYRGARLRESATQGGQALKFQRTLNHERWQQQATEIWKKAPDLSIRAVANQIAQQSKENPETIRRYIKKA